LQERVFSLCNFHLGADSRHGEEMVMGASHAASGRCQHGYISVAAHGIYQQIRYHFVDPENQYRGGWFESLICSRADDMTIIFYDEDNPDRSVPAVRLMFHKLVWKEPPAYEIAAPNVLE